MLKRSLSLLALLLIMIPAAAFAGTLATRVMTTGGSISVNGGAAQTSVNGTVSKSYTGNVPVAMTPSYGYYVSALTVDGTAKAIATPYSVNMDTGNHTVAVTFARQTVKVSATATSNDGSISPYGTSTIYVANTVTYTFSPRAGKSVEGITGLPAGTVLDHALPYAGAVKATFAVPNTNVNIVASFVTLTAEAGTPQTVLISNGAASATLAGSASTSTGTSYAWTQTGGPAAASISDPAAANPSVSFSAAGTYTFKLTATNGATATDTTYVTVTNSATQAAQDQCVNCHNGAGVGPGVYDKWASSRHSGKVVMCYSCHVGANTGNHPPPTVTAAACEGCHSATLSQVTHTADLTASKCLQCHDSHNPAQGIASLEPTNHPAVTLYTFEEVGMQMAGGAKVPVQVDASGKGMPYSPKQTCGTSGCHVKAGVDYTYDRISDHAFHSGQGRSEYTDTPTGKFDATKNKPWLQSTAMVGKW